MMLKVNRRLSLPSLTGLAFALTFFPPWDAHANLIELTSRPDSGNTVYWNQLTGQNFTSTGGVGGSVNYYNLAVQCCVGLVGNFNGDFAPGDYVITSYQAPLTINFNTPVQAAGAQIQYDLVSGNYTAEILAYNGSTLLGSFTENGVSGDVGNNSNIFLGIQDSTADITSIVFETFMVGSLTQQSVAINQLTIEAPATPLPATLPLFATGLGGLGLLGWRRKRKAQAVA
jgi:hypothetical protein